MNLQKQITQGVPLRRLLYKHVNDQRPARITNHVFSGTTDDLKIRVYEEASFLVEDYALDEIYKGTFV